MRARLGWAGLRHLLVVVAGGLSIGLLWTRRLPGRLLPMLQWLVRIRLCFKSLRLGLVLEPSSSSEPPPQASRGVVFVVDVGDDILLQCSATCEHGGSPELRWGHRKGRRPEHEGLCRRRMQFAGRVPEWCLLLQTRVLWRHLRRHQGPSGEHHGHRTCLGHGSLRLWQRLHRHTWHYQVDGGPEAPTGYYDVPCLSSSALTEARGREATCRPARENRNL
mmetsp:Transcript_46938/g.134219  ORF Transcript_46938/g.134219 Transcript_46938/m.134219 type:complete len:220 (+) Transcript_46938:1826-2485(+)